MLVRVVHSVGYHHDWQAAAQQYTRSAMAVSSFSCNYKYLRNKSLRVCHYNAKKIGSELFQPKFCQQPTQIEQEAVDERLQPHGLDEHDAFRRIFRDG